MRWTKASNILRNGCPRDDDAVVLSRREALAGIGLAGVFALAPQLFGSGSAEAKPGNMPAVDAEAGSSDVTQAEVAQRNTPEENASDTATEFSSHRRRRYWRRRYWRRRHWRRRYWRRRYWRRVYW